MNLLKYVCYQLYQRAGRVLSIEVCYQLYQRAGGVLGIEELLPAVSEGRQSSQY
jgi:hypothetical protein